MTGEPITTMMLVAGGAKAFGSIQEGYAKSGAHKYNAAILKQNADVERQQTAANEELQRRNAAQVLGAQAAAFAQSGGGTGGSAAGVMRQSAIDAELDALTMRYEGGLRARGMEAEAKLEKFSAKQAKITGYMNAMGAGLDGVGYGMNQGGKTTTTTKPTTPKTRK